MVAQGTPYNLVISHNRHEGPHEATGTVSLCRDLLIHPLGETVGCNSPNPPLLLSEFGLPVISPTPDRLFQIEPWGILAAWHSDLPSSTVFFPIKGLTLRVGCSY